MPFFQLLSERNHESVHLFNDEKTGLRAFVAIHSTALGPALGGTRFVNYPSASAAYEDVLLLAEAMSYKAAVAGLNHGGGKAVIWKHKEITSDREALFAAFARCVESLGGRYITTEDSGTGEADMRVVRKTTKFVTGFPMAEGGSGDPSPMTALGVFAGIKAAVKAKLGRADISGLRVAILGVGHVGYPLAAHLHNAGCKLTVADINQEACARAVAEFGAAIAAPDEIAGTECDIFAPCALGGSINGGTVNRLRCQIVAGAANNQLASLETHGARLAARGILYAPDYVINAGGLINVAQEWAGYDAAKAREKTLRIEDTLHDLFARAKRENLRPEVLAKKIALERIRAARG